MLHRRQHQQHKIASSCTSVVVWCRVVFAHQEKLVSRVGHRADGDLLPCPVRLRAVQQLLRCLVDNKQTNKQTSARWFRAFSWRSYGIVGRSCCMAWNTKAWSEECGWVRRKRKGTHGWVNINIHIYAAEREKGRRREEERHPYRQAGKGPAITLVG